MAGTTVQTYLQHFTESGPDHVRRSLNLIIDDLEVLRAALDAGGVTLVNELRANNDLTRTWQTEVDADLDEINDMLDFLVEEDGVLGGDYTFSDGAATALTMSGSVVYRIGGETFYAELPATQALEDEGDVAQNKYRAWRVEIDRLGAVTCLSFGDMEKTTAEEALLSLCALALTANTATLGYVVFNDTTGAFNIGTTNVSDSENFVAYYERQPRNRASALTAALGASIAVGSTATNYSTGTRDYMASGLRVAQDAAEADKVFDDNDTIGTGQFGGHLIVTNLANSATYALGSDGLAESASAMTHATDAAVVTQLALLAARLPSMFCLVGTIRVENISGGTFTYNTENIDDASDANATYTDVAFATHDRTATDAIQLGRTNPPVVPATITAPVVPAAVAGAASTTAVDAAGDMTGYKVTSN